MTEIETHIERQIPFALLDDATVPFIRYVFFPAELRIIKQDVKYPVLVNAVMKKKEYFDGELNTAKAECKNFQSLRPTK